MSYMKRHRVSPLNHRAKFSAPVNLWFSFGIDLWSLLGLKGRGGGCLGLGGLGLLPPPLGPPGPSGPPGLPGGSPLGPPGFSSSFGWFSPPVGTGGSSAGVGVSPAGAGVLPMVWELLAVPVAFTQLGVGDAAGTLLGFAIPDLLGGGVRRRDIYSQRQMRSYLRQSQGTVVSSWISASYLSLRSLVIVGGRRSSLCTIMTSGIPWSRSDFCTRIKVPFRNVLATRRLCSSKSVLQRQL